MFKKSLLISTLVFAMPVYADTDLDHGSDVKASAIRDAEKKSDTTIEKTIENTSSTTN